MNGIRRFFLTNDQRVFEVPEPKNDIYRTIEELTNQQVLEVILYYETRNRKPFKLFIVEFDRVWLNAEGKYTSNNKEGRVKLHNYFEFGCTTAEDLAMRKSPLSLPIAPVIPTLKEKERLYSYIEENLPLFSPDVPILVESSIERLNRIYQNQVGLVKEAMKIRNGKR